jgi:hypothetical protein
VRLARFQQDVPGRIQAERVARAQVALHHVDVARGAGQVAVAAALGCSGRSAWRSARHYCLLLHCLLLLPAPASAHKYIPVRAATSTRPK